MSLILCFASILIVPLAAAGLALIHQGLGRSRSAAHAMLATLCALASAAIAFVLIGASLAGHPTGPAHSFVAGHVRWDWLGADPLFARNLYASPDLRPALILCLQMFTSGLAAIIPISAGSDRWRLGPICAASAVLSAFLYPLFAHWVWGGGWLAQLGPMFALPAFTDLGGSSVIHVLGGFMALSVVWIIGPRRGKYSTDGIATAIPGHNIVLVLLGCLLALVGWIGLNCAASLLFANAAPAQLIATVIDATLTASSGALAALAITRWRYRKPDASLTANGWIAGLVAGSASAGLASPAAAILIGLVAGALVAFLVELLELRLLIDDPGGAISVHAGAGLWGLLAAAILIPTGEIAAHLLSQLIGIATLLGLMLPLLHAANLLLNWLLPYRVDLDGEWQGMDIRELGAGAYPEFVIHADEFVPR